MGVKQKKDKITDSFKGQKRMYKNIEYLKIKIYESSSFQKKKLELFFESRESTFLDEFELFLKDYIMYLNKNNMTIEYGIDAYLKMVNDMFKSQVKFMRTGKYPVSKTSEAIDNVYNDKKEMLSYMIGLALSQYLWSTHYEMFNHLKDELEKNKKSIKNYLEIGPGHGLFLKNAIDILDKDTTMTAIDISPVSLEISKSIIEYFYPSKNIEFINEDMLKLELDSNCDFIVMGEVIEHVETPELLLKKVSRLLSQNGKAFLSTCVNCPAIDHVYHFHTVDEIRNMFSKCGLEIVSEKVLPVENLPMCEIEHKKITINYSAIVKRVQND